MQVGEPQGPVRYRKNVENEGIREKLHSKKRWEGTDGKPDRIEKGP